jgi:uncharacterized protein with PQ loop repeat
MPLAEVAGWGGVVVGTLTNLAQARKVARRGTDGVNAATWSLFTLMSLFWLAYGAASGGTEVVVASIVGLPFLVVLLARLEPAARWRGLATAAVALGVVACVPAAILGWDAGLLGLGALIVATRLPQLVELVRSDHARGVSTGSWLLGSLNVTLWLIYYAATARTYAATTMGIALTANLAIVALALLRHRGEVPPPPPVPADELALAG